MPLRLGASWVSEILERSGVRLAKARSTTLWSLYYHPKSWTYGRESYPEACWRGVPQADTATSKSSRDMWREPRARLEVNHAPSRDSSLHIPSPCSTHPYKSRSLPHPKYPTILETIVIPAAQLDSQHDRLTRAWQPGHHDTPPIHQDPQQPQHPPPPPSYAQLKAPRHSR